MLNCEQIKNRIESYLNGAKAEVKNPRGDNAHFEVEVIWAGFEDKSLLEQHKIVYEALGEKFGPNSNMHALKIKTKNE